MHVISGKSSFALDKLVELNFFCIRCGRGYKQRGNLTRHVRYECGEAKKKQICPICGKKYTRPDCVKEHWLKVHSDVHYIGLDDLNQNK